MRKLTRRDFLRIGVAGLGALTLPVIKKVDAYLPEFPNADRLGRTFYTVEIKSKPDPESTTLETVYEDAVLPIQREYIGKPYNSWSGKRLWYETSGGFIPANSVQPVENIPNIPLESLPNYGATPGMWAEVTVPYADLKIDGTTLYSPRLKETVNPRFYYSQVLWIDGIQKPSTGETLYHVIERHGSYGDKYWADARAFRPITPEDLTPINPQIQDKYIVVDVNHQTLACYENGQEILFSRVSTGAKYDFQGNPTEKYLTPPGDYHVVNRKYISLHMAGGEASKASGYEEFAVSWTSIFASGGVAIHSTHFHNDFGQTKSHGCVNAPPDVARFVYRWTLPEAPYEPGMIEIQGYSGTNVKVIDKSFTQT
jgi:lipoprotein-anchoring transpeptidase ErfK/SrfK